MSLTVIAQNVNAHLHSERLVSKRYQMPLQSSVRKSLLWVMYHVRLHLVSMQTAMQFNANVGCGRSKLSVYKSFVIHRWWRRITFNLLLTAIVHGSRRERSRGLINGLTGRRFAVARRACRLRRQQFAAAVLWCNSTRGSTVWAALRRLPLFPAVASPATMPTHVHLCHLLLWVSWIPPGSAWELTKKHFPLRRASSDGC